MIIEVKSDWTLNKNLAAVILKGKAVIDAGYRFEIWLYKNQYDRKRYVIENDTLKLINESQTLEPETIQPILQELQS
jgi:hypothetical protein